jgi:tetratricopeptide (TPR) repeat protein
MKKIVFILLAGLFSAIAFSQGGLSEGFKAKNAGNEAFKSKDYVKAIFQWEKYMSSGEEGITADSNTIFLYVNSFKYAAYDFMKKQEWASSFNYFEKYITKSRTDSLMNGEIAYCMGLCAYKMNKGDISLNYFQKSLSLNFQPDLCNLYMASIYKNAGYELKMKVLLIEAIDNYPNSTLLGNMKSMLVAPLLKDASYPFSKANELAKKAVTGTEENYSTYRNQAYEKFQEAVPLFEKVLKYDPKNEEALAYLKVCHEFINYFNENLMLKKSDR